jgi:hypothetical protein
VIAEHLATFVATLADDPTAKGLPHHVTEEFYAYLQCGILSHGFVRLGCDTCPHQKLLAFSCKKRGFCPSCASRQHGAAGGPSRRFLPFVTDCVKMLKTRRFEKAS